MWLLSPTGRRGEGWEVAGNGESLRNVSSREGWANGARRNAQTRTMVRGRGRDKEAATELSLKKKKIKQQKGHYYLPPLQTTVFLVENLLLSHPHATHQQIHGPIHLWIGRPGATSGMELVLGREGQEMGLGV